MNRLTFPRAVAARFSARWAVALLIGLTPSLSALELDLQEVFRIVEEENPQVLQQRALVADQIAQASVDFADILPNFTLAASQTRTQNANVSGFAAGFPAPVANRFGISLQGTLDILNTTRLATFRQGRLEADIAELSETDFVESILQLAGEAYYSYLRQIAGLEVIDANLERDRILLDQAQTQFDAGVATRIDVTRAEVTLANDERARLQQLTEVYRAELRLKVLLDVDPATPLTVGTLEAGEPVGRDFEPISVNELLEDREDYQAAVESLEVNQIARTAAYLERVPSLSLFGSYGYASELFTDGDFQDEWQIGVSLSMPLWEGGRVSANIQRSKALFRAQEAEVANTRNQILEEYFFALRDVENRFDQIALAEKTVLLSEQELELAQTRFLEGVADNRDVVEAQAGLAEAEDNLVEAIFQYQVSRLSLARAKGDIRRVLD